MEEKINIDTWGLFITLLALAFIILKLCGVITWSWWWVLSPLWIPASIGIVVTLTAFIVFMIYSIKKDRNKE